MRSFLRFVATIIIAGILVTAGVWLGRLPAFTTHSGDATASPPAQHESGPTRAVARTPLYYRNPMGLPDVSPTPKKDSMGMDYIPVYEEDTKLPANTIKVSLDKVQRTGVRTETVRRRLIQRDVRATGTVVPNERTLSVVTVKFPGFVEALSVQATGAEVKAGEPLMRVWIESQEVLRKQVDLVLAMRSAAGSDGQKLSVEAAERNLRLFDFPQSAIDQVKRTSEPLRSLPWTAPTGGTVIEKPAMIGMRFQAGDPLYRLADLSTVWVMAELAERDLPSIKAGQRAHLRLRMRDNASVIGRVDFVYPDINMATRTARVRILLPNPDRSIKLGAFVDATIDAPATDEAVISIPDNAIIDSGSRRVAIVARGEGLFEPRSVSLGARGGGYVQVLEGIAEGEEVVVRGNFLLDAESNLRAALATLTAPGEPK
jgi:Cu(I)/Ag(I) efflux system membrane fusion protein